MKTRPNSIEESLKDFIRQPYTWPGGYPLFLITTDGAALCKTCAKSEYNLILASTRGRDNDGWTAAAVDVNWEDVDLYCDHCGQPIESAYGEVDQ